MIVLTTIFVTGNPGKQISVRASWFFKLLARIGEWHENLSEYTASLMSGGEVAVVSQELMPSPSLPKTQIPYVQWGGGGGGGGVPTFDAESRYA